MLPEPWQLPLGRKPEKAQRIPPAWGDRPGRSAAQRQTSHRVAATLPTGAVAADAGTGSMQSEATARGGVASGKRVGADRKHCLGASHI